MIDLDSIPLPALNTWSGREVDVPQARPTADYDSITDGDGSSGTDFPALETDGLYAIKVDSGVISYQPVELAEAEMCVGGAEVTRQVLVIPEEE